VSDQVVDASLFSEIRPPCLRGSRCQVCQTTVFPAQPSCPRCSADGTAEVELPTAGALWSWTVQHIEPKPPFRGTEGAFVPYYIGYIDLGEVIVESRLQLAPGAVPEIGMRLELTLIPAWDDVHTFAFGPADK
jgi:uncharacterized OB-fold protein